MGMLDRMKDSMDAAKQAQEMANTPGMQDAMAASQNMPVPSAAEQERVHWHNRVVNEGLDGEGTITSIKETGAVDATSQVKEYEIGARGERRAASRTQPPR